MAARPPKRSRNDSSRTVLAIAGGSAAIISTGFVYGLAIASSGTSEYEGRVQVRLNGVLNSENVSSRQTTSQTQSPEPQLAEIQAATQANRSPASGGVPENFSPEYSNIEIQATFLSSPEVIKPVLAQLREQDIHLSYDDFAKNFVLQPTDHHTLEAVYSGQDIQVVAQVLEVIAQTYLQHGHNCQVQVCQNFDYIKVQMEQATQRLTQLQSDLSHFEQQHHRSASADQQVNLGHIADSLSRQLQSADEQRAHSSQQFREIQRQIGLPNDHTAAFEILARSPSYRSLIEQWKQMDQQWVDAKFNLDNISSTAHRSDIHAQAPSSASIEDLEEQHKQLRHQLNANVEERLRSLGLTEMPNDLRDAVVDRSQRLDLLKPWLLRAQQTYLLQARQQHLTDAAEILQPQVIQWQATEKKHQSLHQQIRLATETLERYHHQYAVLYPQVIPRQTVWQLVSTPEVAPANPSVASRVIHWLQSPFAFSETSKANAG